MRMKKVSEQKSITSNFSEPACKSIIIKGESNQPKNPTSYEAGFLVFELLNWSAGYSFYALFHFYS